MERENAMAKDKSLSLTLNDLKAWEKNPRTITPDKAQGLKFSLKEFGDISGIVFNKQTGHLVCGHQRKNQLLEAYGEKLVVENDGGADNGDGQVIICPNGDRFSVRVVDWDILKEKAANVAANNPAIAGDFIQESLDEILRELHSERPDQFDALKLEPLGLEIFDTDGFEAGKFLDDTEAVVKPTKGPQLWCYFEPVSEDQMKRIIEKYGKGKSRELDSAAVLALLMPEDAKEAE